jgi:hypothetical protein
MKPFLVQVPLRETSLQRKSDKLSVFFGNLNSSLFSYKIDVSFIPKNLFHFLARASWRSPGDAWREVLPWRWQQQHQHQQLTDLSASRTSRIKMPMLCSVWKYNKLQKSECGVIVMFLYGVIQMPIQKLLKKEVILVEEGTLCLSFSCPLWWFTLLPTADHTAPVQRTSVAYISTLGLAEQNHAIVYLCDPGCTSVESTHFPGP